MKVDVTDLDFVARTVMAEAEGETLEGKTAVAAVIYNRAANPGWWGKTIIDVCLTARQFSAWNDDNPRRNKIGEWSLDDPVFRQCFIASLIAIDEDPTAGADHYFAHDVVIPDWAKSRPVKKIGKHSFIRLRD